MYAYLRELDADRILVTLNLRPENLTLDLSTCYPPCPALISTKIDRAEEVWLGALRLRGTRG